MNTFKLSSICELVPGFAFKSQDFGDYSDKVIKIADIQPPIVNTGSTVGVDVKQYDINKLQKFVVSRGDYMLAMTGATIGKLGRITDDCKAYINQRVLTFRPNEQIVDKDYLYYSLCTNNFTKYILNHIDSETAQPNISAGSVGGFEISLPSLEEQRRIVDILIAIDRKIEINRRINDNLEQQAQALYRSWFVDFEPFKDGKFIDSELGLIPEGWRVGELSEITNITSGKRPTTKSDYPTSIDKVPVLGASGIMAYTADKLYDIPILIIGRVGTLGIVQKIDAESWPSDNTLVILSKNYHFVYFNLKSIDYQAINRGSTQPLITQSDIKQQMILIPQDEVLMKFEENVNILDKAIKNNNKAIKNLEILRDTLLPKLMSGELKINEIDC